MSKIPTLDDRLKRIKSLLTALPKEIETYNKLSKANPESVKQLLVEFTTNPIIKPHIDAPQAQGSNTSQPDHATELVHIKTTLQLLNKAILGLQRANTAPSSKAKPPRGDAQPAKKTFPTYSAAAEARPKNASVILDLAQTQSAHAFRPRPVEICNLVNDALRTSPHQQVHISAVRWTSKGNLVVIGGPDVPLQHLQRVAPLIAQAFANAYSPAVNPIPPPTRANVRWSKLLINGLPTGASDTRDAYMPEECHKSLAANNPIYASLLVTQKPSWVRPPNSYQAGSSSSLVVAFEDPDGESLRSLLAVRYLYALGTRATVKKWKQRAHTRKHASKVDVVADKTSAENASEHTHEDSSQEPAWLKHFFGTPDYSSDEEDAEIAAILTRAQTPTPPPPATRTSAHQPQLPRAPPQRRQPTRQAKAKLTSLRETTKSIKTNSPPVMQQRQRARATSTQTQTLDNPL